jgi:hypothetical protein
MANKHPKIENLRPIKPLSHEEAMKQGAKGGKASVKAKRERKLLSVMYAELLAKGFEVEGERLTLDEVASAIVARKDSASVSMLKEIREATEGSKVTVDGELGTPVKFVFVDPPKKHADTE